MRRNRQHACPVVSDASTAEETQMKIAIIGAGNVGGALAKSSVRAGHSVTLSAKDPAHAEAKAKETGARAALRTVEATKGARPRRTARVSWSSSCFAFTV